MSFSTSKVKAFSWVQQNSPKPILYHCSSAGRECLKRERAIKLYIPRTSLKVAYSFSQVSYPPSHLHHHPEKHSLYLLLAALKSHTIAAPQLETLNKLSPTKTLTLKLSELWQISNLIGYALSGVALPASPDPKFQVKKGIFHCPKTCTQALYTASHAEFSKTKNQTHSIAWNFSPNLPSEWLEWSRSLEVVTLFRNSSAFELCHWR